MTDTPEDYINCLLSEGYYTSYVKQTGTIKEQNIDTFFVFFFLLSKLYSFINCQMYLGLGIISLYKKVHKLNLNHRLHD